MPIEIDEIITRAFEQAFSKALEQVVQARAEALFEQAFQGNSPLAKKLEERIDQGFQHFIENGIRWERKTPGFDK
jgi:hypothetical protein